MRISLTVVCAVWLSVFQACYGVGRQELSRTPHSLPCAGTCLAGLRDVLYFQAAVYDPSLAEIHVFLDLRAESSSDDVAIDGCVLFRLDNDSLALTAESELMFDDVVHYTGARVICQAVPDLPYSTFDEKSYQISVTWNGVPYVGKIPVQKVELQRAAPLAACIGTLYNGKEKTEMAEEFFSHMKHMQVHKLYAYILDEFVNFDSDGLAWHVTNTSKRPPQYQDTDWTYIYTFPPELRTLYSETTVRAHCLFLHRHEYDYIAFWDIDEFLVIRDPKAEDSLPALVQEAFQGRENYASLSFLRYNHREGCEGPSHRGDRWHHRMNAREPRSESQRLNDLYYVGLKEKQGDKLVVQPLLVDSFYHHFLRSSRPNATMGPINMSVRKAYIKHIRRYPGEYDGCAGLQFEHPE